MPSSSTRWTQRLFVALNRVRSTHRRRICLQPIHITRFVSWCFSSNLNGQSPGNILNQKYVFVQTATLLMTELSYQIRNPESLGAQLPLPSS